MAPCEPERSGSVQQNGSEVKNLLQLNNMKKAIPTEAFEKSLFRSIFYLFFDYSMWIGSTIAIHALVNSPTWEQMPFWQQALASIVHWNIAGFFAWGIFVVGHDCGHTTFSDYDFVNDVIGHICHGSLLVPYYPWQLSHSRHHMYHNHLEKDYSHPWYTPDRFLKEDEGLARMFHSNWWMLATFPLYGWSVYLFGLPDGSHFFPIESQRLWKGTAKAEYFKCLLSTSVCVLYAIGIYYFCGNFQKMLYYYLAPLAVQGWWLFTVTYLQHHNPDTVAYPEGEWSFVRAAFETVDRKFGYGLDTLHHHITDGHVAHHLFFTKIPHYNLPIATKAIKDYLDKNSLGHLYQSDETFDFPYRVHKYIVDFGFKAHLSTDKKTK